MKTLIQRISWSLLSTRIDEVEKGFTLLEQLSIEEIKQHFKGILSHLEEISTEESVLRLNLPLQKLASGDLLLDPIFYSPDHRELGPHFSAAILVKLAVKCGSLLGTTRLKIYNSSDLYEVLSASDLHLFLSTLSSVEELTLFGIQPKYWVYLRKLPSLKHLKLLFSITCPDAYRLGLNQLPPLLTLQAPSLEIRWKEVDVSSGLKKTSHGLRIASILELNTQSEQTSRWLITNGLSCVEAIKCHIGSTSGVGAVIASLTGLSTLKKLSLSIGESSLQLIDLCTLFNSLPHLERWSAPQSIVINGTDLNIDLTIINQLPLSKLDPEGLNFTLAPQLHEYCQLNLRASGLSPATLTASIAACEHLLRWTKTTQLGNSIIDWVYCPIEATIDHSVETEASTETHPPLPSYIDRGFWITTTPVTFGVLSYFSELNLAEKNTQNHPAELTWSDTLDLLLQLNRSQPFLSLPHPLRLPTEQEWEYAARAKTELTYSGSNWLDEVAHFRGGTTSGRQPVKTKNPNRWGIFDMNGNVREWTQERCFEESPSVNLKGGSHRDISPACDISFQGAVRGGIPQSAHGVRLICDDFSSI